MNKKAKKHAHLEADLAVSEAVRAILRNQLDYLSEWEEAARSPEDIEGVHQTRVAFRRMRSALTIFRQAIPKSVASPWGKRMSELAGQLGKARDLDVFIDEVLGGIRGKLALPGGDTLEARVREDRDRAYEGVRAMLDSEAYAAFKRDFGAWVDAREWETAQLKKKQRKLLEGNLVGFARRVLDRQERRVLEAGAHVDKNSAEEMHRLRIECKKLRYAAEFFLPLFAGMDEFIHHMKGLQDLLGVMNDVAVMRGLLDEVLAGAQDPEPLEYAGGIVGWRTCHYHQLLEGFEDRWEELVEAKHPWWKKSSAGSSLGDKSD
jgi:CHAD domain-containing protein